MSNQRLILKFDEWPERDREQWKGLFMEGGIFDDAGVGAHWSAGTRVKFEQSYGYWLAFLQRIGQLTAVSNVAERLTDEVVRAFHDETVQRVAIVSVSSQMADLYLIARALDPAADWSCLKRVSDRYRNLPEHRELKPRPGITSSRIYRWSLREIAAAEMMPNEKHWVRLIRFRDGLMAGLLIARPVRLRAFIGIRIGKHLVEGADGYVLQFSPEDMKDRKSRDFTIPIELVGPMTRYLEHYRPLLLRDSESDCLWISRRGRPLSYDGFQRHLHNFTGRNLGVALRPHAFRHVVATSIAEEVPKHVNIIASVLGHATLTMSERHYNRSTGVMAAKAFQGMIREHRRSAVNTERAERSARRRVHKGSHSRIQS